MSNYNLNYNQLLEKNWNIQWASIIYILSKFACNKIYFRNILPGLSNLIHKKRNDLKEIQVQFIWICFENPHESQPISGDNTPVMLYAKKFGSMNYAAALDQCDNENEDVSLPLPNSVDENDFIKRLLELNTEQAWLGITDEVWTRKIYTAYNIFRLKWTKPLKTILSTLKIESIKK